MAKQEMSDSPDQPCGESAHVLSRAETDTAYARAYTEHPFDERDTWGDLASFGTAARSRSPRDRPFPHTAQGVRWIDGRPCISEGENKLE